ncbi:MAG TPA: hypothetical protein VJT84_10700, partial [Gaiellaceae bacterium]|nr:hypothetical protein [Gaiellaceae bacterium]
FSAANAFIVAGAQDNGSSTYTFGATSDCPPAGCQWSQRIGGDGFYAKIEPKEGQRVFMESQNGNLQRSTSGPAGPYQSAVGGWAGERLSFIFPYDIDHFACPTPTCDHMIAGSYHVWETINGADDWYVNSPDLTKGTLGDRSYINQLHYSPTNNSNAIVGTNDGNVWLGFGLGAGTANSASWKNLTRNNKVLPNRPIQDVTISPLAGLISYVAVGGFNENTPRQKGHVFQVKCDALCDGFTWKNVTGNLPNIPANAIVVNPNAPKQVFVGTDQGLYYTDDITVSKPVWNHFTNGLPNVMIWSMVVDRAGTTLVLFTRSRGAWAIPLPTESATQETLFEDNFDGADKPWSITPAAGCVWKKDTNASNAHSSPNSYTTHPYQDNCNTNFDSPGISVPAGSTAVRVSFWQMHDTESDTNGGAGCPCDFGQLQYSTDNGATWTSAGNRYEGTEPIYTQVTVPLPDSVAGKTLKLRYHFQSDGSVSDPAHQGLWIDDVKVTAEPS